MIAQGFKPVGWVGAVAGAALGCYMLSLNVASERAELARIERQIIAAKQEIRTLQTELGTRGRMQQLEHWNAEVLALSAPTAAQYLDNPVTLARFETKEPTLDDKVRVTMAAAEVKAPARTPEIVAGRKLSPADYAKVAERAAATPQPKVRLAASDADEKPQVIRASAVRMPDAVRVAAAQAKPAKLVEAKKPVVRVPARKPEPNLAGIKAVVEKARDKPVVKTADAKPAKGEPKPAQKAETAKTGDGA